MANVARNHEVMPENLRKQLAVAVRSIQWSYAIFWSLSDSQQGVLEWGDGHYNGDIMTRKTMQAMEHEPDKIGLQRSQQLRELYESLLVEDKELANERPAAALSPEDLTDAEWYYLLCMSFAFNSGQCLPGRALENGETIWLSNAQYADSQVFSRSLLAKSASIQTVVCFPHLNGVIELGVIELVPDDLSLLQHFKASLLDFSKPACFEKSSSSPHIEDHDSDPVCAKVNREIVEAMPLESLYSPREGNKFDREEFDELHGNIDEEFHVDSPDECSKGGEHNHQTEDFCMLDGLNGATSQVQNWTFMDDDFSNGISDSSSECISEAPLNQQKAFPSIKGENKSHIQLKELQEDNCTRISSFDLGTVNDSRYRRTIYSIFRSSNRLSQNMCVLGLEHKSCFIRWKKGGMVDGFRPLIRQNILKKILTTVPLMYGGCTCRSQKEKCRKDCPITMGTDNFCKGHILSDKRRENENFMVLSSMIPSICEVDKPSILRDTIEYLKKLEARLEELESCVDSVDSEARPKRSYPEMEAQTFDNNDDKKIDNCKTHLINKRKSCELAETNHENKALLKDGPPHVKVSMKEEEVVIEMRCLYTEYILLDIMDAISNLQLEAYSVSSSNHEGVLTLSLKSKFRGVATVPAGMIKQALWEIAGNCCQTNNLFEVVGFFEGQPLHQLG